MSLDITVPVLPESVPDAIVANINCKKGDLVNESTVLIELETDKIMIEVPAPSSGQIENIKVKSGDKVKTGDVLVIFEEKEVAASAIDSVESKTQLDDKPTSPPVESKSVAANTAIDDGARMSPSVRKLLQSSPVTQQIEATGSKGRVMKSDILRAQSVSIRQEKRVAMTRIRAKIAERLLDAQQSTACLTTFNEVDMHAVMKIRANYKKEFESHHNIKLGFMSFFIKACCVALQQFPEANASIDGKDLVYRDFQDIGIAVSTDRGLVVPIIRDAHRLSLAELEMAVKELAIKARDGKLTLDDMSGGTFSITNAGKFGSMLSTPILNPPQAAILGMHNIIERPVVINGQIEIRPIMYLALTYDHRIIDGSTSVQYLMMVKKLIEDPTRLLLDI